MCIPGSPSEFVTQQSSYCEQSDCDDFLISASNPKLRLHRYVIRERSSERHIRRYRWYPKDTVESSLSVRMKTTFTIASLQYSQVSEKGPSIATSTTSSSTTAGTR